VIAVGKSRELQTTTELVKGILEECPEARNSDNVSYIKVLNVYGEQKGINLENMSVVRFFMHIKDMGVPSIETVGRCRRKIVETHPELAGNDTVEGYRTANEETFREYARKVMV
jgi:hypothetical protein